MKRLDNENECLSQKDLLQAIQRKIKTALQDNPDRSTEEQRMQFISQICSDIKHINLPMIAHVCASDMLMVELKLEYGSVFLWIVFRNNILTVNVYSTITDLSVEIANMLERIDEVGIDSLEINALRKQCQKLTEENEKFKEVYRRALEASQILQGLLR